MIQINLIQSQSLKTKIRINNNLIIAIKILQMSHEELQNFIKKEAEKNPLITLKKPVLYQKNHDYNNISKQSIKDWLYQQSSILHKNYIEEKLVQTFIENLDDNGFCRISTLEAAKIANSSDEQASNILKKLKNLEPIGIFSQNLEELLTIQLIEKKLYNNSIKIIINNLDLIATHNIEKLSRLSNINKEQTKEIINIIKKCKPRPIDSLDNEIIKTITPDIFIEIEDKKIKIKANNQSQYEIYLNKNYINNIKLKAAFNSKKETQRYIKEHISHTNWLKNNIDKRNKTLLLVAKKIINYQKEFFFHGESKILPLTHKYISETLNIHESTVSRAVKNKFVKYSNNTIPLSYFFSSKIKNSNVSSKSIKDKIKQIIKDHKIVNDNLSDQKITNLLNKNGIMISRRTVTKYRLTENIPNSQYRSRKKES